jgi:integrase
VEIVDSAASTCKSAHGKLRESESTASEHTNGSACENTSAKRNWEWIADLQREGKLKPRSIKNVWKVLRLILGKKRVKDWTIRLPKNPKKEQRWFTVLEMERIIDAAWGQYKCLFQLARATGMRSGELFGLRAEDLDLENAIVHVRRSAWGHLEVTPKTDAGHRDVDIDAQTVRMLKKHLGDRKADLVFPSRNNTPLVNRNINVDVLRVNTSKSTSISTA